MYNTLIVEDEYWMCKGLQKVISRHCPDFNVVHMARDGLEALEFLQKESVDVVITDIRMPGMDGLELIKHMRNQKMRESIIIITGHSEFIYAKTAIRYGVKDYLLKPLNTNDIMEAFNRLKSEELNYPHHDNIKHTDLHDIPSGSELIGLVLERINTSYMNELSLSVIASETGFNSSYLSRLFKEQTGESFVKYINKVRIREAKQLLKHTSYSIGDISKKVGFWDDKYFSRFFKREVGKSPSEFRLQ